MNSNSAQYFRILTISPSTFGFGFVVLEGNDVLVRWGAKSPRKNKNDWCVIQADNLIRKYQPNAIVLYDHAKNSQRSLRIQVLNDRFASLAKVHKVHVELLSSERVKELLIPGSKATKYEIAKILADRLPDELAVRLPPKRRPWTSEDRRMDIFDAMALAVAFRRRIR